MNARVLLSVLVFLHGVAAAEDRISERNQQVRERYEQVLAKNPFQATVNPASCSPGFSNANWITPTPSSSSKPCPITKSHNDVPEVNSLIQRIKQALP